MIAQLNRHLVISAVAISLAATSIFAKTEIATEDHPVKLDRNSKAVVDDTRKEAKYKLPADGKVWLYDVNEDKALYAIDLDKGDEFAFNADQDRVYCNGKEGDQFKIDNDHKYRIYYLADTPERTKERVKEKESSKHGVPDTAKLIMEGRDKELSYSADAEGMAYLWDNTNNKLIETFHLMPNDRLTISPKSNAMAVNQKTVSRNIELSRRVEYRLLWKAGDVKK